jgi:hypothetical protein
LTTDVAVDVYDDWREESYVCLDIITVRAFAAVDPYDGSTIAFGASFRVFHIDLLHKLSGASMNREGDKLRCAQLYPSSGTPLFSLAVSLIGDDALNGIIFSTC